MKRKINIDTTKLLNAISEMCLEYNKEHIEDPIVSFSGRFYLAAEVTETTINIDKNIITTRTYKE
jgi:hypothetical protein